MMLRPKTWLAAMRAAAGQGAPLVPFASLPAASTVEGQVRRLAELPHVSLIALGGIWRPLGGRQVLAKRTINPVTVQDLAGAVAETIGPFPGGLVRAGMELEIRQLVGYGALTAASRISRVRIGTAGSMQTWIEPNLGGSALGVFMRSSRILDVLSDTSAAHISGISSTNSFTSAVSTLAPVVDFSAEWLVDLFLVSAAETAVNIATATWVGGVATYNTSAASTLAVGDKTTIAGVSLAGYNGVVIVASVVDTDTFTVAMASDPGGSGTGGTSSRISNMISQSYVLELVG